MWFDPSRILSFNRMINFVVGNRGGGKTFNTLELCIRRFLKGGHQFIYLRRYKSELDNTKDSLFDSISHVGHFPDHEFKVDGTHFFIDGEVAGYGVALSTSRQLKSKSLPKCDFIVFDEFLLDKGRTTYIKDEVRILLDLIETVGRMDSIRVMLLSNAVTMSNIYFDYFGITPNRKAEFTKHPTKPIVVQLYTDNEFIEAKKQTQFGQLIEGTSYGEYAIHNMFTNDSYEFIEPMKSQGRYLMTFDYMGHSYGVYSIPSRGIYHINSNVNPSCTLKFAFSTDDHKPNFLLFSSAKKHPFIQRLKYAYEMGFVRFDTLSTKNAMYALFDYL